MAPRFRLRHVARYLDEPARLLILLSNRRGFGQQRVFVHRVRGEVEVVDGDVAALPDVFEGNGTPDARGAARYGGGFGEEEIVRHSTLRGSSG